MDGRRTFRSLSGLSYALVSMGLLSFAIACFAPPSITIPAPSKERSSAIKKSLAALRGLEPKTDFEIAAAAAVTSQVSPIPPHSAAIETETVALIESAYRQLGLLTAKDDLKLELVKYHRLAGLITYDHGNHRLSIAADAGKLGSGLRPPHDRAGIELPLAMGVVHALQEQHFQWQEKINRTTDEDTRLAYRAVAGGDGVLTALAYLTDGNLAAPAHLTAARQISRQMEILGRDLPPFLRNQLLLPYREGSDFVAWAAKSSGRKGLNALYANPPAATAQILHPEKYYLRPQTAQRFHPIGLLRYQVMPALVEQSLGEFLLRGLLETEHAPAASSQIAAGWRGDQLFAFTDRGFQTTAWFSSWSSAEQAARFQRAFQPVVENRQRVRLRRSPGNVDELWIGSAGDRRSVALTRTDQIVVYLVTTPDRLAATVEAAWKDLEVLAAPEVLHFDSARAPAQLSLSKR